MIRIQKAEARGRTKTSWLDSRHSFSFGQYYDEEHMHFGPLRVLNDDVVQGGGGFPTHPHREMEILTYVVYGTLEHRDSTGGHGVIRPGELQRMTAGTGITHSEFNHSQTEELRFLQVWMFPAEEGLTPGYVQRAFPREARSNALLPVAAQDGAGDALTLHQDAEMLVAHLDAGHSVEHSFGKGRGGYLFVIDGEVEAPGHRMRRGDALLLTDEEGIRITAHEESEIVLFDVTLSSF